MKLIEYLDDVDRTRKRHPDLRYGQVLFNVLYEHAPDLADKIRGKEEDPFHATRNDPRIAKFLMWLVKCDGID